MTKRQVRIAHCYRCVHTWRMRYRLPRVCPRCKSRRWNVPKIRPIEIGTGLGVEEILGPHRGEILRLARRYGARNVRVFGSIRRRQADERSDADLLLEWKKGTSSLDTATFRIHLKRLLGRDVDTVEDAFLHWAIRPQILAEAVSL